VSVVLCSMCGVWVYDTGWDLGALVGLGFGVWAKGALVTQSYRGEVKPVGFWDVFWESGSGLWIVHKGLVPM
jgi:hypothetical protein